jgi:Ca2+-binding RTX toxin-like protein
VVITANTATGKIQVNSVDQATDAADVVSLTITGSGNFTNVFNVAAVTRDAFPSLTVVRVDGGGGDDTIQGTQLFSTAGTFITQTLSGGTGNDTILGGNGDETINGGDGVDNVQGQGGNDSITGGRGDDILSGGDDDDTFTWNDGDGSDRIDGASGQNSVVVNGGILADDFALSTAGATQTLRRTNLAPFTLTISNNSEVVVNGGNGNDTFRLLGADDGSRLSGLSFNGNAGTNFLVGPDVNTTYFFSGTGSGRFRMPGGLSLTATFSGIQNIVGGAGNDVFRLGAGAIAGQLSGGRGINTLSYFGEADDVFVNLATGRATNTLGISGIRNVVGGAGDDRIFGDRFNNRITGGAGNDVIIAGLGNDFVDGGAGDDIINGEAGNDILRGSDGDDTILGGDGRNYLFGGAGDDELRGGNGNDRIFGGLGADTLIGGLGFNLYISAPLGEDIILPNRGDRIYQPRV